MFKTVNGGKFPTKATKYSAGVDIYANESVMIGAGDTALVPLGIAIDLNFSQLLHFYDGLTFELKKLEEDMFMKHHYLSLKPRSSLRAKGLISHSGVIDLDFEDEIKMIIHNPLSRIATFDDTQRGALDCISYKINKGDRIGQLLLMKHEGYLLRIESEEERAGGFGSTS